MPELITKIKIRYDSYSNWTTANPVLLEGEMAVVQTSTELMLKVGNGVDHFSDLDWVTGLAKDVYSWAKAETKPSYSYSEITNKPSSSVDENGVLTLGI